MGYYLNKNRSPEEIYRKLSNRNSGRKRFSVYRGVTKGSRPQKPYRVSVCFQGVKYFLGEFENELDAARAYNKGALRIIGEAALLNELPEESQNKTEG